MKICFYSPYLPKHFGGGEKYLFDCAKNLCQQHQVYIAINNSDFFDPDRYQAKINQYQQFLNYPLNKINFIPSPLGTANNFIKKLFWTKQFDCLYYVTDGSFFLSLAKKNILHIQIPFTHQLKFFERLKLANWSVKNANSKYTQQIVEKSWQTKIQYIHYPVFGLAEFNHNKNKKEKIILNVGRFFTQLHHKRQDIIIKIFKGLIAKYPKLLKDWQLILIGSVEDDQYYQKIKKNTQNLPIKIITNIERKRLNEWYQKANFFISATGYGVDQKKEPKKVEHFGISLVEAMTFGAIPLATDKGGHREILNNGLTNCLYQTIEECQRKIYQLINDQHLQQQIRKKVINRASDFSNDRFKKILNEMLSK